MSGRFVIPDGPFVRRGRETRFVLLTEAAKERQARKWRDGSGQAENS